MGLNDIQLTHSVTAALYGRSLIEKDKNVDGSNSRVIEPPGDEPSWKFLGNNERNVLIMVNYPDTTHLPDDELSFLANILAACKLSLGDVAIVNLNNYAGLSYKDFTQRFQSKSILLFGVEPVEFGLPIDFPHYQVQSFANCNFLFSPALEKRHEDELFKSKLWVSLRRIFGV